MSAVSACESAWSPAKGRPHLVFVPHAAEPHFVLWGDNPASCSLHRLGTTTRRWLIDESLHPCEVAGTAVSLLDALSNLALMSHGDIERSSASVAAWSRAAKLALDLVARERLLPRTVTYDAHTEVRFAVALGMPEDAERVMQLATSMPLGKT